MNRITVIALIFILSIQYVIGGVKMVYLEDKTRDTYRKETELPESVINAALTFAKENPQYKDYYVNNLTNDEIITSALVNDKYDKLPNNFRKYTIRFKATGKNLLYINILHDKEKDEAYILNKAYDIEKISLFIKSQMGNLPEIIGDRSLYYLSAIIMEQYSVRSSIADGFEVENMIDPPDDPRARRYKSLMRYLTISKEELKAKFYWPELKLCSDMKYWEYKFIALMSDGSVLEVLVKGTLSEENDLIIKEISDKILFPAGSIKIKSSIIS
jgi:hypothetical protein